MQQLIVTLLIAAAAVYVLWALSGSPLRRALLAALTPLLRGPLACLRGPLDALQRGLEQRGGCAACRASAIASHHPRGRALKVWLVLAAVLPALPGPAQVALAESLQIKDDTGATLRLAAPAKRIISLAPGATEMLFAAGAGDRILATVTAADAPEEAKKIPRIGDANAIVFERLIALRPDVVVVWKDLTNELIIDSLVNKLKLNVYYVSARSLEDIPRSVRRLGELAGTSRIAAAAAAELQQKITALTNLAAKPRRKPLAVFYMIWDVPLYTVGSRNIIADAIARCGGRNLYDDIDFPAPIVEFEDIKKRNPDVILMATTPITARDWRERWAQFPGISAVAERQVLTFSDPRLSRMGPGAIDAVPALCKLLEAVPR